MWFGVDGPNDVRANLAGMASPLEPLESFTLTSPTLPTRPPAYSHVLLDVLSGGYVFAVRDNEAKQA